MAITLELIKASSYYFTGRLSIGAYIKNGAVILFDSGLDKSTAQSIDKIINKKGLKVSAIINTHSHADHCGGNNYFQKKYKDIKIYATDWEKAFIEQPYLEPFCFCGGAQPFSELRNKHLETEPSIVTNLISPYIDQNINLLDEDFKIITLSGHTPGMIGIITPDNVLYCGDAAFGNDAFSKHSVLFYTNILNTIHSLTKLSDLKIDASVFYHGGLVKEEIKIISEKHIEKILNTSRFVLDLIVKNNNISLDKLTQAVMQEYEVPGNIMQFTLTRTCVVAYAAYLEETNKIKLLINDGLLEAESILEKKSENILNNANIVEINEKKSTILLFQERKKKISDSSLTNKLLISERSDIIQLMSNYTIAKTLDNNVVTLFIYYTSKIESINEIYSDTPIINAIEFIIDILKYKGLIKNDEITITGFEGSKFNDLNINYKISDLAQIDTVKESAPSVLSVVLFTEHVEVLIKDSKEIHLIEKLSILMDEINLKNGRPEICVNPRYCSRCFTPI